MHELVPGLLIALDDGRMGDARAVARVIADEVDEPEDAAIHVGIAANLLHRHPELSLAQLAVQWSDVDSDFTDNRPWGDIGAQFLDALNEQLGGEPRSEEARQFLSEFAMRPGSTELVEHLLNVTATVVADLTLRAGNIASDWTAMAEAQRDAIAHARTSIAQRPDPSAEVDD